MICQWCHQESSTIDVCEWCKRPLKQKRKSQPSPGAEHMRAKALAQVKKNDRLLIYAMLGVILLTTLAVGYTAVFQPDNADELPAYLPMEALWSKKKKEREEREKENQATQKVEDPAATPEPQSTEGEAPTEPLPTEETSPPVEETPPEPPVEEPSGPTDPG